MPETHHARPDSCSTQRHEIGRDCLGFVLVHVADIRWWVRQRMGNDWWQALHEKDVPGDEHGAVRRGRARRLEEHLLKQSWVTTTGLAFDVHWTGRRMGGDPDWTFITAQLRRWRDWEPVAVRGRVFLMFRYDSEPSSGEHLSFLDAGNNEDTLELAFEPTQAGMADFQQDVGAVYNPVLVEGSSVTESEILTYMACDRSALVACEDDPSQCVEEAYGGPNYADPFSLSYENYAYGTAFDGTTYCYQERVLRCLRRGRDTGGGHGLQHCMRRHCSD